MATSLRIPILLAALLWLPRLLSAQQLDPSFRVAQVYKFGAVRQVAQQPDGKRLVLGDFTRIAHQTTAISALVRLLPNSNQPDSAFLQNTQGLTGYIRQFLLLANGKILLMGAYSPAPVLQSGTVSRQALLLLNADGTPDAAFNAGTGPNAYVQQALQQPDGKILLCGTFTQFSGQVVSCIVRLNGGSGTMDSSFQTTTLVNNQSATARPGASCFALQPDGRILIAGGIYASSLYNGIARLMPTGRLDSTFRASNSNGAWGMAVQADGKVVLADGTGSLVRLLPTGALDAVLLSFGLGSYTSSVDNDRTPGAPNVQIQPGTGRIIVRTRAYYPGSTLPNAVPGTITAFTAAGVLDATFNNAIAGSGGPYWIHLLSTGQLLVGGPAQRYGGTAATKTPLALLTADGLRDNSVAVPLLQTLAGGVAMALQPDGKIVVGGDFTEINGLAVAGGLARLHANGEPDSLYSVTAAPEGTVTALALQPDGKLLVAGGFSTIGGGVRPALARLLSSGQLDATYSPTPDTRYNLISNLLLQADGRLLVSENVNWNHGSTTIAQDPIRLLPNGQFDTSFQPSSNIGAQKIMLQPDGKILASGRLNTPAVTLWRWLPSGALDNTFTPIAYSSQNPGSDLLAQDGQGRIYYQYSAYSGSSYLRYIGRVDGTGQPDISFNVGIGAQVAYAMAVQPNQRLLVGLYDFQSAIPPPGTTRLLSSGTADPSYQAYNGPSQGVGQILIQPDGAILMSGSFTRVSSIPTNGIARLIDPNVLSVAARHLDIPTAAWPVPTHNMLNLRLSTTAHPQRVSLLDALGKTVLTQPATQAELTLNTTALAPGIYLLRVDYAAGPVTRRITIE